jgi:hypothetical protein
VNEYIFFSVVSVDEAITRFDIEPFDRARYFCGDYFFGFFVFCGVDAAVLTAAYDVAVGVGDVFGLGYRG